MVTNEYRKEAHKYEHCFKDEVLVETRKPLIYEIDNRSKNASQTRPLDNYCVLLHYPRLVSVLLLLLDEYAFEKIKCNGDGEKIA